MQFENALFIFASVLRADDFLEITNFNGKL